MNWTEQVFTYCERGTDASFWAEPLNALTNFGFIAVAFYNWRRAKTITSQSDRIWQSSLAGLVGIIGIGSFLFHTMATRWAAVADFAPITVFMLAYLGTLIRLVGQWRWAAVGGAVVAFFLLNLSMGRIRCDAGPCLNGSLAYLPSLLFVAIFALLTQGEPKRKLQLAASVFFFSVVSRTLDRDYCHFWQLSHLILGSHFLWHLLNALTLHLLLTAARNLAESKQRG